MLINYNKAKKTAGRRAAAVGAILFFLTLGFPPALSAFRISPEDEKTVADYAFALLRGENASLGELKGTEGPYRKLFISVYKDGKTKFCQSGSAKDEDLPKRLQNDIAMAVQRGFQDKRFGPPLSSDDVRGGVDVVFDFLYNRKPLGNSPEAIRKKIVPGIHALQVVCDGKGAFFKSSVPVTHRYGIKRMLGRLCRKAGMEDQCYESNACSVIRYDSKTFKSDARGNVVDLCRYNVLLREGEITPEKIKASLWLAADWYKKSVNPGTGLLHYEYYPARDVYSDSNNYTRQVAVIWAIAKLEEFFGNGSLSPLIRKSLDHYLGFAKEAKEGIYIDVGPRPNIAFNAFMILALLDSPDYPEADAWIRRLAGGILGEQREDGSFILDFQSDDKGGIDYYPGETLLALMKLYEKTREKRYLHAVEKAFPYYRDYWRGNKNTAFVPWHSQADYLLYRETGREDVARFVFEMTDWILGEQNLSPWPDERGGFRRSPGNSTASYLEGLNDAYETARLAGDEARRQRYGTAIRQGIRYVMQTQCTWAQAFFLPNADRAVGGFRQSVINNAQRIDYTQHAAFALMKSLGTVFKTKD
ncbi:MAG TPA: AMMECR1 domain-containing protein [Candidatus Omnitrophota bacterium]|nr:AMMECR1 domain-containing protein [Candidatus Omnitrophota bacterium]